MSKSLIRLYFNGEKREPYRLVQYPNAYFNKNINEFILKEDYYYNFNGLPSSLPASVSFKDLRNVDTIKIMFYKEYIQGSFSYIVPLRNYCELSYAESEDDTLQTLDTSYAADMTLFTVDDYHSELTINLKNLLLHNSKNEPTKTSRFIITFNRIVASTEQEPYSGALIRFNIEFLSNFVEYDETFLQEFDFIRTINSNNDLPNYGISSSDGSISIIDKNDYIQQRILNNAINVNIITDIILNGNMIAKLVGYNAKYPYASKLFTYNFDDYLSLLSYISCETISYVKRSPNQNKVTAYDLYYLLVEKTKDVIDNDFEPLDSYIENYYKQIVFTDPLIICSNYKEMWEQFLIATMSNMFINEKGTIEVNAYNQADESKVYEITIDKQQQDVEMSLINSNIISMVNGKYLSYNEETYENVFSSNITFYQYNSNNQKVESTWFRNAKNHDYTQGEFTSDEINFTIIKKRSQGYSYWFEVIAIIDLKESLLSGKINFVNSRTVERTVSGETSERQISTNYELYFYDDEEEFYNEYINPIFSYQMLVLNTTKYGYMKRKVKFIMFYQIGDDYIKTCNLTFDSQAMTYVGVSVGENVPYKNSLVLQDSSLITDKATFKNNYLLYDYILNTTLDLYKNGRKTISFTTNNFNFESSDLNSNISREKGEILKVGSLIKLVGISDLTFKITKISGSFSGQFNLKINAIEYVKESSYKEKLETPNISLSNKVVSWSSITNANSYDIYMNTIKVGNTANTSFSISNFIDETIGGSYNFFIKAISNDSENYVESDASNIVEYEVLQLNQPQVTNFDPTNLNIIGDTLMWRSVENATSYTIFSNDTVLTTVGQNVTQVDLSNYLTLNNSYKMNVVANASGYLSSEKSLSVYYVVKQLEAPVLSLNNFILSWLPIEDADNYDIYVDNVLYTNVSNTTFSIESIVTQTKTYTFYIVAKSQYDKNKTSENSNIITYQSKIINISAYFNLESVVNQSLFYIEINDTQYNITPDFAQSNPFSMNVRDGAKVVVKTIDESQSEKAIFFNGTMVAYNITPISYTINNLQEDIEVVALTSIFRIDINSEE